jgi:hypothetical protein
MAQEKKELEPITMAPSMVDAVLAISQRGEIVVDVDGNQ